MLEAGQRGGIHVIQTLARDSVKRGGSQGELVWRLASQGGKELRRRAAEPDQRMRMRFDFGEKVP
jgi:hypothetical protein